MVTSSVADAFPAGLPVGTVHYPSPNLPVVEPYATLDHVSIVRLFDYGLAGIAAPDAPGHVPPSGVDAPPRRRSGAASPGANGPARPASGPVGRG